MHTMTQVDDLSRSLAAFDQNTTLVVVVEMSAASWVAAAMLPGVDRQPVKKLDPDPDALWRLVCQSAHNCVPIDSGRPGSTRGGAPMRSEPMLMCSISGASSMISRLS
jgi:transposase